MNDITQSWRALYERRQEIRRRYKTIWSVPLERRVEDVIRRRASAGASVLDIGGAAKFWERRADKLPDLRVKTLNIDPEEECDYRSLDEAPGGFDLVLMVEMIEHVSLAEGVELLRDARSHLKPGGELIVTTPNIHHPTRFWDATHVTPWRYDELGGALLALDYRVLEVWRLYNAPALERALRRSVGVWLHRYLGVDFAPSVALVAQAGDA